MRDYYVVNMVTKTLIMHRGGGGKSHCRIMLIVFVGRSAETVPGGPRGMWQGHWVYVGYIAH